MYEMKKEYYTGIEMIDSEHQQLFNYANEVYELLQQEFIPDKYDNIIQILEKLRDYTKKHFADEEAYMEAIQYKKIFTQKVQYQNFINKLDELDFNTLSEQENQDKIVADILNFLTDWLVHHILEVDTRIPKSK